MILKPLQRIVGITHHWPILVLSLAVLGTTACGRAQSAVDRAGSFGGDSDQIMSYGNSTTPGFSFPGFSPGPVGLSQCRQDDSSHLCLALKYIVFADREGTPAVKEPRVRAGVGAINQIWNQCGIQFSVDQFMVVDPKKYNLSFHTSENWELDEIRKTFMDSKSLLVVTTGTWDRTGSLGNTGANAWTSMPGERYLGAVLEAPVGDYPNIIAHELGHYLNLDHMDDTDLLMNPVIYEKSKGLTKRECLAALGSIRDFWSAMVR